MSEISGTSPSTGGAAVTKRARFLLVDVLVRMVKTKPMATVGLAIVVILFIVGVFAPLIAPFDFKEINMMERLKEPQWLGGEHILGTDSLGRDLFSRIVYGARVSMIVGLSVAAIASTLATLIGGVSGFLGGKFDLIVQRFVDAIMSIPPLLITLTAVAILGPGLLTVIVLLGIVMGIGAQTRVVRAAVVGIRQNVYIEAAQAIGVRKYKIFFRHVLPNVFAPIIVLFSVTMGQAILIEATLSFLGFGIPPPTPSWGGMISESGRRYMILAPWLALWPGLALAIVVYGVNMLGDGLRDLLDPRLRGGLGRYGRSKMGKV